MELMRIPVDDYTTPNPITVDELTPISQVLTLMDTHDVRHVPVLRGLRPVGILSQRDLNLVRNLSGVETLRARDVMISEPYVVHSGAPLGDVVFHMSEHKIGSAIVVGDDDRIDGIFTLTDALNALIEVLRGDVLTEPSSSYDESPTL